MEKELQSRGTVLHGLFSTGKAKLLQAIKLPFIYGFQCCPPTTFRTFMI